MTRLSSFSGQELAAAGRFAASLEFCFLHLLCSVQSCFWSSWAWHLTISFILYCWHKFNILFRSVHSFFWFFNSWGSLLVFLGFKSCSKHTCFVSALWMRCRRRQAGSPQRTSQQSMRPVAAPLAYASVHIFDHLKKLCPVVFKHLVVGFLDPCFCPKVIHLYSNHMKVRYSSEVSKRSMFLSTVAFARLFHQVIVCRMSSTSTCPW